MENLIFLSSAKCVFSVNFLGGLVKDICNCCYACAKQEGESCGGVWGMKGKCDKGLWCFIKNSKFLFAKGICGMFFLTLK